MFSRRLAVLAAGFALLLPSGGLAQAAPDSPSAVAAKSCSRGFKHAVVNGSHKCLRRGQYCSRGADRQYHRYGFHCHRYSGGGYRLQ